MNDRFKFRVWFTPEYDDNEMIYDAQATYDNACEGKGSFHHCTFQEVLDDKNCVVMQCTGLKDKNGKLIFEGDILKDKYGALHPISWNKKCFFEADTFALAGFYNAISEDMEVVGNIYENKELLDGE